MAIVSESSSEVHPVYLCDQEHNNYMGITYSQGRKDEVLRFIESSFGRMSQREMARRMRVGKTTINTWSAELGFKHKKHTVNERFFDVWNEYSAYILGYVFADGNVSWDPKKGYQSLTITASEKDKIHLIRIRKIISSTKPLTYGSSTRSYRLIANSKILCKRLMRFGVVPRKSLIVEFPDIPKDFLKHFIRGVIDGDGTVRYVDRNRSPYFEIQVSSGSKRFLEKMEMIIHRHLKIQSRIHKIGENTYLLRYSCKRGEILAKWIYTDADLYLPRKRQQYRFLLEARGGELND